MLAPIRNQALRHGLASSPCTFTVTTLPPAFLLPAWHNSHISSSTPSPSSLPPSCCRSFSTTAPRPSKLGRTPISVPPGVELIMGEVKSKRDAQSWKPSFYKTVTVKGPLGSLELTVPEFLSMQHDAENSTVLLSVEDSDVKHQKEMWGTSWSYLNNYITGVSEGHTAILRLVGVGYRATVERRGSKEQYPGQRFLCLKLGFTHPVEEGIPEGVKVTTPAPTRILLEGNDREALMSFAGRVRKWRPPEPYKGKGIFINDQTIKLKQKKIK